MCLTCGCMDAHLEMGEANITYEDIKRAADENGRSITETLDIMERTKAKDREQHPNEYGSSKASGGWVESGLVSAYRTSPISSPPPSVDGGCG